MPFEERFRQARCLVPLLGKVLSSGRLVPDEPLLPSLHHTLLNEHRHEPHNIVQNVEFALILGSSHATRVTLGRKGRQNDRDRSEIQVELLEVDVAVSLHKLNCAPQDALESGGFRKGLELSPNSLGQGVPREMYARLKLRELLEPPLVAPRIRRLPLIYLLVWDKFAVRGTVRVLDRWCDIEVKVVLVLNRQQRAISSRRSR